MAIFYQRRRSITLRVSEDEYSEIEKTSMGSGSRSVSDFARNLLLLRVRALSGQTGRLAEDLSTLTMELSELDCALSTLHSKIGKILGSVRTAGGN